jgi:ribosomal protein S27E
MQADRPAIYRPRRPHASPLWQCVRRHLPELRACGRVRRAVEKNVLERFLDCGDPHRGFARIRCAGCGHDLLLAFSCKTRYFCPSCHQKRVLAWGAWVEQFVLRPVAHRQYVFTVPKLIRPFFAYRRSLRCARPPRSKGSDSSASRRADAQLAPQRLQRPQPRSRRSGRRRGSKKPRGLHASGTVLP